ncbi:MAG: NAD(P)-binding protein, partial [Candidatus Tectomicrobia bacterium]|nr:NAD(P)-binding protein [Candidatus Tectomicrobia bacterium]
MPGKFQVELPDFSHWQKTVKCQDACPVHTDARGYVAAIAEGDPEKAYVIAREPNPFASICGRVCAAPCEIACRRGDVDAAIAIRALKRFVTERFGVEALLTLGRKAEVAAENLGFNLVAKRKLLLESHSIQDLSALQNLATLSGPPLKKDVSGPKRVAVIGSGVAGLTCAHDLAVLGYRVTVFEAQKIPGGMLVLGVPEYRLPRALIRAEIDAILELGVDLKMGRKLGRDFSIQDLRAEGFDAIFIAIGAHKTRELRMDGVEFDGVFR